MNILLMLNSPNGEGFNGLALVPSEELKDYNLDALDGYDTPFPYDESVHFFDNLDMQMTMIFDRFGIDAAPFPWKGRLLPDEWKSDQDLKKYLHPVPPFIVDKIVTLKNI
jgi:hypothetical protein